MTNEKAARPSVIFSPSSSPPGPRSWPLGFVHDLPNHDYHRGPGLSNSGLKLLRKSPWHYHSLNGIELPAWMLDEVDGEGSAAMFAGTLCHCATLEPFAFDDRYAIGPALNKNSKEWKAFVEAAKPRQVISRKQYEVARAQATSLRNLADVREVLDGGEFEVSGYWIDPATGVLCRCRPDCMNRGFGGTFAPSSLILDVKTTQDASTTAALRRTIANYGYHHQADWYTRGVEAITRRPVAGFVFAFVESTYPFAARCVELDRISLEIAREENDRALQVFAHCQRMDEWPAYRPGIETVSLPRWAGGEA